MDISDKELVPVETLAQCVVSYIAIITSLVLLASAFAIFCLLKGSQTNSNAIHISLVASIFLEELIFLIALKSRHTLVDKQFPCKMVAILLHFLFLSSFSWLLVEAIHIYRMISTLKDVNHGPMHYYFFIGYGGPAFIVSISVGVSVDDYGNYFFCWLSVHETVVWSLVGPICFIVFVTLCVFFIALKSSMQVKETVTDYGNLKTLLWLAIVLLPIQGAMWVLAMLSVNETHVILQYTFSAFCLIEGLYVFIGYCVINRKVQYQLCQMWIHTLSKKTHLLQNPKITYGSTYNSCSRISHRSIGVSTCSATSHSTGKTSTSPRHSMSHIKVSVHNALELSKSKRDVKHAIITDGYASKNCNTTTEISNDRMKVENSKQSGLESLSPGPRMGVNIFSYPNLPSLRNGYGNSSFQSSMYCSQSPMNKSLITLRTHVDCKDQGNISPHESQISSPLSAPICSTRPEFPVPRMGISGVGKLLHTSQDKLDENSRSDVSFKTGNVSAMIESSSKNVNTSSSMASTEMSVGEICPTSLPINLKYSPIQSQLYERRMLTSKEHLQKLQKLENFKSPEICEKKAGEEQYDRLNGFDGGQKNIPNQSPTNHRSINIIENPMLDIRVMNDSIQALDYPVCIQDNVDSFCDRGSPKLIDDTPSEEDYICYSIKDDGGLSHSNPSSKEGEIIPPLATAELSDIEIDDDTDLVT